MFTVYLFLFEYQDEKDQQWKQAMDYLSAVTELNYMTQIVIMLYEDNNKVGLQSCRTADISFSFIFFQPRHCSFIIYIRVVSRTPPQRSVFMSSFTSAPESKAATMRRTYLWASASAQPPQRCVSWCFSCLDLHV